MVFVSLLLARRNFCSQIMSSSCNASTIWIILSMVRRCQRAKKVIEEIVKIKIIKFRKNSCHFCPVSPATSNSQIYLVKCRRSIQTLFDFTKTDSQLQLDNWIECSDTQKHNGSSKAALVIHKSHIFQRAIFFSVFVPMKHSGMGFAAIRCDTKFDLSEYIYIAIKCRGQGVNFQYKMILRHKGLDKDAAVYGQTFTVMQMIL